MFIKAVGIRAASKGQKPRALTARPRPRKSILLLQYSMAYNASNSNLTHNAIMKFSTLFSKSRCTSQHLRNDFLKGSTMTTSTSSSASTERSSHTHQTGALCFSKLLSYTIITRVMRPLFFRKFGINSGGVFVMQEKVATDFQITKFHTIRVLREALSKPNLPSKNMWLIT